MKEKFKYTMEPNIPSCQGGLEISLLIKSVYSIGKPIHNYSKYQHVSFQLRGFIIEWLYLINSKLNGSPQTLFQAIGILDYFLEQEKTKEIARTELELYGAVSYFISNKLEEVSSFTISFLRTSILKNKFEVNAIVQAEQEIIRKLHFHLQIATIQTFSELIISTIVSPYKEALKNINFLVNLISQFINEFIFLFNRFSLALITVKASILILVDTGILTTDEASEINFQVEKLIDPALVTLEEVEEISESLFETFKCQRRVLEKKEFFRIFFEWTKNE